MHKGKPSLTARKVALNLITLAAKPGMSEIIPQGAADTTAQLLVASGVVGEKTVRLAQSPKMVAVYEAFDWMLPGQFEAFAHRKAFCEQQVRDGIKSGAAQVLVLGAGYDTLCWRLAPEFPGVNFFEIDHPATASCKAKGIAEMGSHENLFLIAEDLGKKELVEVMESQDAWDTGKMSVIIAEGLIMYLPPEAVETLFRQCAVIGGAGSRIAFSYIPKGDDGRPDAGRWTGLMLWLQNMVGESWLWSIAPEELGSFLRKHGWTEAASSLKGGTRHGVEYFAVART